MINRWLGFTACMVTGGGLGFLAASEHGLVVGLLLASVFWMALDSFYVERLLGWLRIEQKNDTPAVMASAPPRIPGVWGEAADRTRRLLKNRDQQYQESQARLDEFLAAMQASPSGVVLLDAQGRIEWCNQMATQHFGFDAQRDVLQHIANLVRVPAFKAYMASGDFTHDVLTGRRPIASSARSVE